MPTDNVAPRHLYWDACVFIDYFQETPGRIDVISEILKEIKETRGSMIYTSIITITEVNCVAVEKLRKTLDPNIESRLDKMWRDRSVVTIIELNQVIATIARDISRQGISRGWNMKPLDSIHLASAFWVKRFVKPINEIHTYDDGLKKYDTFVGIDICPPNVVQPSLGMPGV